MFRPRSLFAAVCCLFLASTALADNGVKMPNLTFHTGGRVIQHVKLVPVFWGPDVSPATAAQAGPFYKAIASSTFFDFLNEYNTVGLPNGGQTISAGSAVDPITITPMVSLTSQTTPEIVSELRAQIQAGKLPTPDEDTLFMVHFPPGLPIDDGRCTDWCAYHGGFVMGTTPVRFSVLPDLDDPGCLSVCQGGYAQARPLSAFEAGTVGASHEMIEAITDPDVPASNKASSLLSWYDEQPYDSVSAHAEIGDICEVLPDIATSIPGAAGASFVVQREWSNKYQGCIVSKNDVFPITLSDTRVSLTPGGSATMSLSFTLPPSMVDPAVEVLAFGVPDGVKLVPTVVPAKPQAGQTAQLTFQADSSVPLATYNVELVFQGARASLFKMVRVAVENDGLFITTDPVALTLNTSGSAQVQVITRNAGNPKQVTLSAEGLPDGVSASFDPATVAAGETSTLTLTATAKAASGGPVAVQVKGTSGSFEKHAQLDLTVHSAGGCASAGGAPSWSAAVLLLGLLALRRRAR